MEDNSSAIPIRFSKEHVERVLDCIRTGGSIAPLGTGWTLYDMLEVAGVLVLSAGTHPTMAGRSAEIDDLLAAVAFHSQLTEQVLDDTYDVDFEAEVVATVAYGPDQMEVQMISGHKGKG